MSCNFEWSTPTEHPLAIEISKTFVVLSVLSVESEFAEYSLYRNGGATQCTLAGVKLPKLKKNLPNLDLSIFERKGLVCSPEMLQGFASDPERFLSLAGPDSNGYRGAFDMAPLDDYPKESFLIFSK